MTPQKSTHLNAMPAASKMVTTTEKSPTNGFTRLVCSRQLFAGQRELIIEHQGEHYHLRVTRQNKLILTK